MFPLLMLLISATAAGEEDIRKVLEFQYQQKLADVLAENAKLKAENRKLLLNPSIVCDSKENGYEPPLLKINGKAHSVDAQASEQKVYRQGLKEIQDERWDDALLTMEGFVQQFPSADLAPHAIYWMAQIYLQKNESGLAKAELERLIKLYPQSDRAKRAEARLSNLTGTREEGKVK